MIKNLLNIEYNTSEDAVQKRFELLAKQLFNQYEILKGEKIYNFLEIEFYFYSNNHPDNTTYKRNMPAGKWYTHLSGIDITFESNNECYGGILIRSIIDNKENVVNGPLCTLFELFDNIDIEGESVNIPLIRKKTNSNTIQIESTTRFGINSGMYKDSKYRYYDSSKDIKWKSGYTANPTRNKQLK